MRKIERRIGDDAVVDESRHGEHGRAVVGRLRPRELSVQTPAVRAHRQIRGRHQKLLRVPSPVERRLEHRQRNGIRKLLGPVVDRRMRVDDQVARRLGAGERAVQAAQTGRAADRREAHVAKLGAGVEAPRLARGSARERQAHVGPFPRGGEIAQPLANVLLRHEPQQRQQGLRPQVIRIGAQLQHACLVLAPACLELAVGVGAARGYCVQPPPRERPSIGRVRKRERAAHLIDDGVGALRQTHDHAGRAELELRTLDVGAVAAHQRLECAAARIEAGQILGQQITPAGEMHPAGARERIPTQIHDALGPAGGA
jgi:hypothetical protein